MAVVLIGECNWTSKKSAKLLQDYLANSVPDSIADMRYKVVWKPLRVFRVEYCVRISMPQPLKTTVLRGRPLCFETSSLERVYLN